MSTARDELFSVAADDMPVSGNEVNQVIDAYRAEVLREAADGLAAKYPDPNPLASVFAPYVGAQMVAELRRMASEGEAKP